MKTIGATVCYFQRSKRKSPTSEKGIAISWAGEVQMIVDINFKPVPVEDMGSYTLWPEEGCFQTLAESKTTERDLTSDLTEDR